MKPIKWTDVKESGNFEKLPAGWYVLKIVAVEDVPSKEYVKIVWDVAEGDYADHYENDEPWSHNTVWSYKDAAQGMFKSRLIALQDSNPMFTYSVWERTSNEKEFVGLVFGAAIQERYYTNDKGEDKTALEVARVVSASKARENAATNKELPKPRDNRESGFNKPVVQQTSVYSDDDPFL